MFSANRIASLRAASRIGRTAARSLAARTAASSSPSLPAWRFDRADRSPLRLRSTAAVPEAPRRSDPRVQRRREDYDASRTLAGPTACAEPGLDAAHGIRSIRTVRRNPTFGELFAREAAEGETAAVAGGGDGVVAVTTGAFTGRSPKDKWIVRNEGSESASNVDWGEVNQPTSPEVFDELYAKAVKHFNSLDEAYVFDGFCGANPATQKKVRFIHEQAWQSHFVTNMFIRPSSEEQLEGFEPDFTVINCCSQTDEDWERHGLNSEVAVVFNIEKKVAVIFGTWYGGENKKGIFSLMNYWLPLSDPPQLPMHCSANVGLESGDTALFFGLSGTGKTTLSADPRRALIGDDEHGWDEDGIYNFEGGCYAKTINLSEKTEPDIYRAIRTDAMLENVVLDEHNVPDYSDVSITQNGRVSYPIFHIDGFHEPQMAGHPKNIIFLTCDAFGVLPPLAKLSPGQAMYHFISGYTAKVAGTERGVTEPTPNFSACFGAAFLTLCPTVYADLLRRKLETHGCAAYLVNTGWSGGGYGVGERMSIETTRGCVDAILDGSVRSPAAGSVRDPVFGFEVPTSLDPKHGVDAGVLVPEGSWSDKGAYDEQRKKLAGMFVANFEKYAGKGSTDYTRYGPQI